MAAISEPQKYQCALLKSSRKHYENAIEACNDERNAHGHLVAAVETAENAGDAELAGWLGQLASSYESTGALDEQAVRAIVIRYNEYNAKCGWGLEDFNPDQPLILPGGDDAEL